MKWRVIPLKTYDSAMNMAIDAAIYESVIAGESPPTIRFYKWEGGGVSLGSMNNSSGVNTAACDEDGVSYIRRPTGGNVVYHHPGDFTYSVVAPNTLFDSDFEAKFLQKEGEVINRLAYQTICQWVISSLKSLGLDAQLVGRNDVVVNDKKVAGNAQTLRKEVFLQHGSIFYSTTAGDWIRYLNHPEDRLSSISGIDSMLDISSPDIFYDRLFRAFTENDLVDANYELGELTEKELRRAEELAKERFTKEHFAGDGKENPGKVCAVDIVDD
jgi:lipoate-protein ligase A